MICLMKLKVLHCRSREGAWIEIAIIFSGTEAFMVAPARERGLKFYFSVEHLAASRSLPRGSVD